MPVTVAVAVADAVAVVTTAADAAAALASPVDAIIAAPTVPVAAFLLTIIVSVVFGVVVVADDG